MRVLLVNMPFAAADRPSLGISLLKSGLSSRGVPCDIRYANLEFASHIGLEEYNWVVDDLPYTAFAGEWCFTLPLYGRRPDPDWDYVKKILVKTWKLKPSDISRLIKIRESTPAFIEKLMTEVDWNQYDIVGFTSTFAQNIASLALAGMIKREHPQIKIVFGGANWEDEMGMELHKRFPFVDYVCQGESDESFPALLETLANKQSLKGIPGIVYRTTGGITERSGEAKPVDNLDALPIPDFTDYYQAISADPCFQETVPSLLMESSRGCWWGNKSHCTFCGLNGDNMGFRSKSAERAFSELEFLAQRWKPLIMLMVDNILDMKYFKDLLPKLAQRSKKINLFYETKSNLKRSQVRTLHLAGVNNIQPGIESLSDHILNLMGKGTTALRNIQLLKWCREYGVNVDWNLLYGFPGETREDYDEIEDLLPLLSHLDPPSGIGPIRLDRFSPYHQRPQCYGLDNLRPLAVYQYLYPFGSQALMRIASYFDFEYHQDSNPMGSADKVVGKVDRWSKEKSTGQLIVNDYVEYLKISDSRDGLSTHEYELHDYDRIAYLACDRITTANQVLETLRHYHPYEKFDITDVELSLRSHVERGLSIEKEGKYLALGVYRNFPEDWNNSKMLNDFEFPVIKEASSSLHRSM